MFYILFLPYVVSWLAHWLVGTLAAHVFNARNCNAVNVYYFHIGIVVRRLY